MTFLVWFRTERTLSIHAITTARREAFYWLVVLFTFALGTAAGDLLTDRLSLTLLSAVVIFSGALAVVFVAWRFGLGAMTSFWVAYILTRPLGGSSGDWLSGDPADGGLGLGTLATSLVFVTAIVATVVYLTITGRDRTELCEHHEDCPVLGAEAPVDCRCEALAA